MRPRFAEFVILMAALMSLNALAIDAMVPALPAIGDALAIGQANDRQLVVSVYLLGFGLTQLFYGPLSDRFGRKRLLGGSLFLYIAFAIACAFAQSFELLLVARCAQGGAAAGTRVLVIAIVRDRFEGPAMARLMSLVFLVFLLMPVLAPVFGQLTLLVASWRWIFLGLAIMGSAVLLWAMMRLPETLEVENRRPLSVVSIVAGIRETLTNRQSLGYTLAFTLMIGALTGYLVSIQQIIFDVFRRPELIAASFAAIAIPMGAASLLNSRIVERVGTYRIAHLGLSMFTVVACLHYLIARDGESLTAFLVMQGLMMACFAIGSANFGALAMQPLGHVAGTASSVQGTITTCLGTIVGTFIGQSFDNSVVPLVGGSALLGGAGLVIILLTERGRLFRRG